MHSPDEAINSVFNGFASSYKFALHLNVTSHNNPRLSKLNSLLDIARNHVYIREFYCSYRRYVRIPFVVQALERAPLQPCLGGRSKRGREWTDNLLKATTTGRASWAAYMGRVLFETNVFFILLMNPTVQLPPKEEALALSVEKTCCRDFAASKTV